MNWLPSGGSWLRLLPLIFSVASILLSVVVIFGSAMMSKLKWRVSELKWSSLRDSSDSSSPSWDWLARWTGKWKGYAYTVGLWAICLFVSIMVGAVLISHRIEQFPTVEMHNVEVDEVVGDFSYWFIDDQGKRVFGTFCDNLGYKPPFDRGETIQTLKFKLRGVCWDMHDVHPKYVMLRNENGDLIDKHGNVVFKEN